MPLMFAILYIFEIRKVDKFCHIVITVSVQGVARVHISSAYTGRHSTALERKLSQGHKATYKGEVSRSYYIFVSSVIFNSVQIIGGPQAFSPEISWLTKITSLSSWTH